MALAAHLLEPKGIRLWLLPGLPGEDAVGYGRDGDYGTLDVAEKEEEEDEGDEDDSERMQLTEESGVHLALGDWARARISI